MIKLNVNTEGSPEIFVRFRSFAVRSVDSRLMVRKSRIFTGVRFRIWDLFRTCCVQEKSDGDHSRPNWKFFE
jgi:hypothetical protein